MKKKNRSGFHIDENVFISMIAVSLLSLVVMAFRYTGSESCTFIKIDMTASRYEAGVPVYFKAEVKNGKKYIWSFGDNSKEEKGAASVIHIYSAAGKYTITLTVNDKCIEAQTIVIKERRNIAKDNFKPLLIAPDTALLNQPVTFTDITPGTSSWQWQFGESGATDAITKSPVYIFTTPGVKTVTLIVDGRTDKAIMHTVYIKDPVQNNPNKLIAQQPVKKALQINADPVSQPLTAAEEVQNIPKEPDAPKAPEISNDQLADAMMQVITGEKDAGFFSKYTCGDTKIMVVYNGATMTLQQMCNELKEFKKVKKVNKPNVLQTVDGTTGCIKTMNVTVKKKALLDRLLK